MADLEVGLRELVRELVREEVARALADSAAGAAKLVTVAEYAARHALGCSTVRRAIAEGRLAVQRIGRAVRIPADATIAPARGDSMLAKAERRLGLVGGGGR